MVLPSLNVTCYGKFNTLYAILEIFLLLSFVKDSSILQFCGDSAQWTGIYHLSELADVVVITILLNPLFRCEISSACIVKGWFSFVALQ